MSAIILMVNIVLTYVSSAMLAKIMGPEDFGLYSFIIATVTILTIPAFFGLPTLIAREVAAGVAKGTFELVRGLVRRSRQFVTAVSLILIVIALVAMVLGSAFGFWVPDAAYFWAIPLVAIVSWGAITGASLRGLGRVLQSQWPDQVLRPLLLLLIVGAVILLPSTRLTPASAAAATAFAAVAALAVNLFQWWRGKPAALNAVAPKYSDRRWLVALFPMAMSVGILVLNAQISLVLIRFLSSTADVGLFRISSQTAQLCALGYTAVIMNITPRLAGASAHGDMKTMRHVASQGAFLATAFSIPVALTMMVFSNQIVTIMFGEDFRGAALSLAILAGGQVVNSAFGCAAAILNMSGHERDCTRALFLGLVIQVIGSFALIPSFGVNGAAVASVAGILAANITLWIVARMRTGIDAAVWAWRP